LASEKSKIKINNIFFIFTLLNLNKA
jgi:hypothetical protein